MSTAEFTTLFTWDTVQSADSTEWCPLAPCQNVFVCGTYQIETGNVEGQNEVPAQTSRHGKIFVFQVSDTLQSELCQIIDLSAVLDMKWSQTLVNGKILLAVVTATAELLLYEFKENKNLALLTQVQVKGSDSPKEVLALSLDWSSGKPNQGETELNQLSIVVSDSHGGASIFELSRELNLTLIKRWQGHNYEAWIAAFNYWEPSTVFSGGDDCVLNGWDLRTGFDTPIFVNRSHNAGVTSLQSNALFENILVSGSYDEYLRIWDLRKIKHPLYEKNMFGGVWRVKWNPLTFDSILTACMHGGFHVVDCKNALKASGEPTTIATYKNHESIAYGADWCHLRSDSLKLICSDHGSVTPNGMPISQNLGLVTTCSFYDHKLCMSLLSKPEF